MAAFELSAFYDDMVLVLNVKPTDTIAQIKQQISFQTGAPAEQLQVLFDGAPVADGATVAGCRISANDMIVVQLMAARQQQQHQQHQQHDGAVPPPLLPVNLLPPNLFPTMPSATANSNSFSLLPPTLAGAVPPPAVETAESIIARLRSDPDEFTRLMERNPQLATAILEDPERAKRVIDGYLAERQRRQAEIDQLQAQLRIDPFNIEAQRKIEEAIRLQNVEENMNFAMEHTPEVFAQVSMLYIDCEVNNTPVKAFVDSGAQMTIMSQQCAERCGISRLIDVRSSGMARGVGTSKIIGRIHSAMIRIGESRFACSITVLESIDIDFLLGLDMLRKHQCCIDLEHNVLRIGGETAPFLSEKDIPKSQHDDDPLHRLGSSGSLGSSRG